MTSAPTAADVRRALRRLRNPAKAKVLAGFFKTGRGDYGEGDRFLGVTVPAQRRVVRDFRALPLPEIDSLLRSPWHEDRLTAVLLLDDRHRRAAEGERRRLHRFYLAHSRGVNNWDLVDLSAPVLLGSHVDRARPLLLDRLARSSNVWERRMAMVATFHFIRQGDPGPALRVAERLVDDPHDLIRKAVGWMLREVGKRCTLRAELSFLDRHAGQMPRTMLRYAIERLPAERRAHYLGLGRGLGRRPPRRKEMGPLRPFR